MSAREPESIQDLIAPDRATLHFTPLGLSGGLMLPQDSLSMLRSSIAHAKLATEVPENVRGNFQRLRKLHLYGLLDYEFFSAAADLAHLVLEGALRVRFVTFYGSRIPITKKGTAETLDAPSFQAVWDAARRGWKLASPAGECILPTSMGRLFQWARREQLLTGQRSVVIDEALSDLRNYVAHPEQHTINMPPASARVLSDVAEIINKLWGVDTPGGRLFPASLARLPRAAAVSPDGTGGVQLAGLRDVRDVEKELREWTFAVYLAAADEELCRPSRGALLFSHRPGFQTTNFPCELMWGPGRWADLIACLDDFDCEALSDHVQYLDRVFLVRSHGAIVDDPRSPADFESGGAELEGCWHVIRADNPGDALRHVRQHRLVPATDLTDGRCSECRVTELGRFNDSLATREHLKTQNLV